MDHLVVNGYDDAPSQVLRAHAPVANYVVNSRGAAFIPQPVILGRVDYTGLHRIVNRYGVTGGGGSGPSIPAFGQVFPTGR